MNTKQFTPIGHIENAGAMRAVGLLMCDPHDRLILQLRDNWPNLFARGCYCLFGGGVENDETPIDACIREISEEAGLSISADDMEPFTYSLGVSPDFDQHYIFRLKRPIDLHEIRLGEGAGYGAFDKAQLNSIPLSPNLAPPILHYAHHIMRD